MRRLLRRLCACCRHVYSVCSSICGCAFLFFFVFDTVWPIFVVVSVLQRVWSGFSMNTGLCSVINTSNNLVSAQNLFSHHAQRALRHIVRRVHARIRWSDDWHEMFTIGEVCLWIPDLESQRRISLRDCAENDWIWPLPARIHKEELAEKRAWCAIWIQLADSSCENGPCDTSKISHDIRIHSALLCPLLDRAKCRSKRLCVWNQPQNSVGDAYSIDCTLRSIVDVSKY
mmetsp:Transcript_8162/g.14779  ORF Transcript_8162/g.14779 Transcript_8162/m.14779 type:complete len:229 (+) Transcript_8162:3127-3813(+)